MSSDTTPEKQWWERSGLCDGIRPIVLDDIILTLLRDRFSRPDELDDPRLRGVYTWRPRDEQWTPDGEAGNIFIEDAETWIKDTEMLPAFITKRKPAQPNRVSIGDKEHARVGFETYHQQVITGMHLVLGLSFEPKEASALAGFAWKMLRHFSPVIRRDCKMKLFQVGELGETSILEEAPQVFAVPIPIKYAYDERWKLESLKPPFKAVGLHTDPK